MSFTHQQIHSTAAFLTFRHVTVDVRDHSTGALNILPKLGNSYMCIDREFGLGMLSQQQSYGNDETHVENMKDPDEVRPPARDSILVALCAEMSRNHIPLSLLDDIPFDLRHGSGFR